MQIIAAPTQHSSPNIWLMKCDTSNFLSLRARLLAVTKLPDFSLLKSNIIDSRFGCAARENLSYLKYLIGDTCQRPITAKRSNFEDVNAPRINVIQHRAQSSLMRRLDAVYRQAIARKRIGVHQRTLEARNLRHCAWRARSRRVG